MSRLERRTTENLVKVTYPQFNPPPSASVIAAAPASQKTHVKNMLAPSRLVFAPQQVVRYSQDAMTADAGEERARGRVEKEDRVDGGEYYRPNRGE